MNPYQLIELIVSQLQDEQSDLYKAVELIVINKAMKFRDRRMSRSLDVDDVLKIRKLMKQAQTVEMDAFHELSDEAQQENELLEAEINKIKIAEDTISQR